MVQGLRLQVESNLEPGTWNLEFGIWNFAMGSRLSFDFSTNDQDRVFGRDDGFDLTFKVQDSKLRFKVISCVELGIWNLEFGIWNFDIGSRLSFDYGVHDEERIFGRPCLRALRQAGMTASNDGFE